jgi:hypothetical protein
MSTISFLGTGGGGKGPAGAGRKGSVVEAKEEAVALDDPFGDVCSAVLKEESFGIEPVVETRGGGPG